MNLSGLEEFTPSCKCVQCGSYNTVITYTKPRKQRRGHRCHDCQRPFQSAMLDVPENEPTAEAIREAIERVKTPLVDRKGYWTRIGRFIRVNDERSKNGNTLAVYRCDLCQRTSLLKRHQFSSRKLCDCQLFDPDNPCDQFRKATGKSVSEAAKANGVPPNIALVRIRTGWDLERAVSEPVRSKRKKGES